MTARSWNASARPAERPPAGGLSAGARARAVQHRPREQGLLWAVGAAEQDGAVCSRRAGLRGRIHHQTPDPQGEPSAWTALCSSRSFGARGPSGRRGPASRVPSATPTPPPPPRVPASSPPPPPYFSPFCFSGTHRVPGEMERVGDQVSVVGSVAWGPGRRQEDTWALDRGCALEPSRCVPAPWVFIFAFLYA